MPGSVLYRSQSDTMWRYICALIILCAALSRGEPEETDKRSEMSPGPFLMSSRYGRSSPRMRSPRTDKMFFLPGRYGKRSEPLRHPITSKELLCEYTGIYQLYRCTPPTAAARTLFNLRRGEDSSDEK